MKTRLLYFWKLLLGSFWFIPVSIVLIAILLALGLVYFDVTTEFKAAGAYRYLLSGGADAARSILSTIAGAMIGVAGTVFSITLVALTMASQQFGPRLLQNFMYDRINQIVLGSYIATFIYCLIVLRTVKSAGDSEFTPNLSIMFAIFLAIANIVLLVIYVHHTALQIQADQVVANINASMRKNLRRLINREKKLNNIFLSKEELIEIQSQYSVIEKIRTNKNGYLQAINFEGLLKIASQNDLLLKINFRPGDFLIVGEELLRIHSKGKCDESILQELHDCFITGSRRTATQDADFGIHQMVEIASRALSPGVNDPYTAINCIDNLTAIGCYLTQIDFPKPNVLDNDKKLRLITKPLNFEKFIDTAFNQIRQYGSNTPAILIRLMEDLTRIASYINDDERKEVIDKHINIVLKTAERNIQEKADLDDLLKKYNMYSQKH